MFPRISYIPTPPLPAVVAAINFNVAITVAPSEWKLVDCESHRFLYDIRADVLRYRLKSPSRFAVAIEVGQVLSQNVDHLQYPYLSLWVGFYNFGRNPVFALCRPVVRKRRDGSEMPTGGIEIYSQKRGKWVPLEQFLRTEFRPIEHLPVGDSTMFEWWSENGKVFNWPALPVELKQQIVQFCYDPHPRVMMMNRRMGPILVKEVTEKFGSWVALLRVSREVRGLCLRTCFAGSTGMRVEVDRPHTFKDFIRRLSKCPTLVLPGGLPTDETSHREKDVYDVYPTIYPHLKQYATLRHLIRKITLSMSFLDYMHFFRVTAGSFAEFHRAAHVNYQVFESMPALKRITITLPSARENLEDSEHQLGPRLFYGKPFNCPRTLHRIIYERIADSLAAYDTVTVKNFMEDIEKARYNEKRKDARAKLKIRSEELEELYKDEGGGVALEKWVSPGVGAPAGNIARQPTNDPFWPPRCRCEIRCQEFLFPSEI